jgi:hypothetical protein
VKTEEQIKKLVRDTMSNLKEAVERYGPPDMAQMAMVSAILGTLDWVLGESYGANLLEEAIKVEEGRIRRQEEEAV